VVDSSSCHSRGNADADAESLDTALLGGRIVQRPTAPAIAARAASAKIVQLDAVVLPAVRLPAIVFGAKRTCRKRQAVMSATSPKRRILRSLQFTALSFVLPDLIESSQLGLVSVLPDRLHGFGREAFCLCHEAIHTSPGHDAPASAQAPIKLLPARQSRRPGRLAPNAGAHGSIRIVPLIMSPITTLASTK
jgi:hypothetical protein